MESILCILLAEEAFSLQEVGGMQEDREGGWPEARGMWWIRQNFTEQRVQPLKHWFCDMPLSVVEWNCAISAGQ